MTFGSDSSESSGDEEDASESEGESMARRRPSVSARKRWSFPPPFTPVGGLCGISDLNLEAVKMTDCGSLHLSHIVERNHNSEMITFHAFPASEERPPRGVTWTNNEMTFAAIKLLETFDKSKAEPHLSDYGSMSSASSQRRSSIDRHLPTRRRSSACSDGRGSIAGGSERERLRTRLEGSILRDNGIHVCLLWATALRVLLASRILTKVEAFNKLPFEVQKNVLISAYDPEATLSTRQYRGILDWSRSPEHRELEHEWAGKLPHVQQWRMLEAINCLSYEFAT